MAVCTSDTVSTLHTVRHRTGIARDERTPEPEPGASASRRPTPLTGRTSPASPTLTDRNEIGGQ